MQIRPYDPADEDAVVALWERCGLTRPWNDPRKDIRRKLRVRPDLSWSESSTGPSSARSWLGTTGIAAGSTTSAWTQPISDTGSAGP